MEVHRILRLTVELQIVLPCSEVVASTLQLQYGNVLLATSSNKYLQALIRNDWPFFVNNTALVEKCLQESHCDRLHDIIQKLGIVRFLLLFLLS